MIQNKFGQLVFNESDVCNLLMQGHNLDTLDRMTVDDTIDLDQLKSTVANPSSLATWNRACNDSESVADFHAMAQSRWHMPDEYQQLDIAAYILSLCNSQEELQRCGAELLLYQEQDLFDLLKYLKYLVDTMTTNQIIWGVGRGSSVSSYVLYKLGVHRIDSLYYNLDIREFLR